MARSEADLGRGESPQVGTRGVVAIIAVMLVLLSAIAFGLQLVFSDRVGVTFVERHDLPAPGVTVAEREERLRLQREQEAALQGSGGRMPIDRAMEVIAGRGAQAFDPVGDRP